MGQGNRCTHIHISVIRTTGKSRESPNVLAHPFLTGQRATWAGRRMPVAKPYFSHP